MAVKRETLTLILVNLAAIMEKADESLLPGVYNEVATALHTDPTGLGSLTLLRSIVQASCYPLAAFLACRYNRAHVIALGAFLWSAATFLVGFSSNFTEIAISRGLNGIGLAIVTPAIQSLIADSTEDSTRGTAFGWLQLTGNMGSIIGGLSSILLASSSFLGVPGWRIAFHLVGIVSVLVGILVRLFADDPREPNPDPKPFSSDIKALINEAKSVLNIPSFQIIVAQGVAGSFPWSALAFAPMWLELMGFSHKKTAFLMGIFVVSSSLGGLLGGKMGDSLAGHFPNAGRIVLSQVSSFSAIPLSAVLLLALPYDPSSGFQHGAVLFIMGLFISWNAAATNNPIFAEIVPEEARVSIYALDRSFESVLSSFAPPVVGLLAQHVFGYRKPVRGDGSVEVDRGNATSLGRALYAAICVPMAACCLIYSFLYGAYPRDRERARMGALIRTELKVIGAEERTVIDVEYWRDADVDCDGDDDVDDKAFLAASK